MPAAPSSSNFLSRVAARLETLKPTHKHLRRFTRDALSPRAITYRNAVTSKPNPDYDRLVREQAEEDRRRGPMLRAAIPKQLPVYDPLEGCELHISLISTEDASRMQRVVMPFGRIGSDLIEVSLIGAETWSLAQLRGQLMSILAEEVRRTPGGHLRGESSPAVPVPL